MIELEKSNCLPSYLKLPARDFSTENLEEISLKIIGYPAMRIIERKGNYEYKQYEGEIKCQLSEGERVEYLMLGDLGMNGSAIFTPDNIVIGINCGEIRKKPDRYLAFLVNEEILN